MIEKMLKIMAVVRRADQDRLLEKLRELGAIHLEAVDPAAAVAEENLITDITSAARAVQALAQHEPAGTPPQIPAGDVVAEVLKIERSRAEGQNRLTSLHRQLEHQAIWGNVRTEQLQQLADAGVNACFLAVDPPDIELLSGELIQQLGHAPGGRTILAVVNRGEAVELPESVEPLEFPAQDNPTLLAEAAEIDAAIKSDIARLAELAQLIPAIEAQLADLQEKADYSIAARSGLTDPNLFAIQGWIPARKADAVPDALAQAKIEAGIRTEEPTEEDTPPTLIRYAAWARPIAGLFDILGTFPGYRELDLSSFFMLALPLFAAILIGDAGYGVIFALPGILFYKKMVGAAGKAKTHLLITIGIVTLIYGILSANYFGITPDRIALVGGFSTESVTGPVADIPAMQAGDNTWATIGNAMMKVAPLWDADGERLLAILIKMSFLIGCIHLVLAHLRMAIAYLPDLRFLAEIGWSLVLLAMLGIIWLLFFGATEAMPVPMSAIYAGLIIGGGLAILFGAPSRNPVKRIAVGLAAALLPSLGTFSDTMSYIRLMAVGMASYYIAAAFNQLASDVASVGTWFAGAPIAVFGHALNIGLAVIAIFAHGVRLNMLEFSNNAGVQWGGHAYSPFAKE